MIFALLVLVVFIIEMYFQWLVTEALKRKHKEEIESIKKGFRSCMIGKGVENLVPFTKKFGFLPQDARFISGPIDYVVFSGITKDKLKEIVFVEVKTGKECALSYREKEIKKAVEDGRVRFVTLKYQTEKGGEG